MRARPGEGLDRGGAGIARGRAEDRDRALAATQEMLEQPRQQLHGDVLEGERRPVEQLEQPLVRPELAQRRDRGVIEPAVGRHDQLVELCVAQILADERRQHPRGHLLIGRPLQRLELISLKPRPTLGQIQPAIGREPGEQRRLEATSRHAAAAADVANDVRCSSVRSRGSG